MEPLKMLGDGKDRQDNFRTTQVRDAVKWAKTIHLASQKRYNLL
jgi:hypothetical protein